MNEVFDCVNGDFKGSQLPNHLSSIHFFEGFGVEFFASIFVKEFGSIRNSGENGVNCDGGPGGGVFDGDIFQFDAVRPSGREKEVYFFHRQINVGELDILTIAAIKQLVKVVRNRRVAFEGTNEPKLILTKFQTLLASRGYII